MNFSTTIIFYLLPGLAVGISIWLKRSENQSTGTITSLAAILFWPLFLPLLLDNHSQTTDEIGFTDSAGNPVTASDNMSAAIDQVEAELDRALNSLDGWSDEVFQHDRNRIHELKSAWHMQAERIRELEVLLSTSEFKPATTEQSPFGQSDDPRLRDSEQTRSDNIERLRSVRTQMQSDLMATLAWVRELATMIHLARFTGAPASRAEELVAQIAASVEGLSEVTSWKEEPVPGRPFHHRDAATPA